MITWGEDHGLFNCPIMARTINYNESKLSSIKEIPGIWADYPSMAAGPTGDFLVAWQDHQDILQTDTDIFGQLFGNRIYIPLSIKAH
jgi:hypothetical protein